MQVHVIPIDSELDQHHWRFLCSDLHIESPDFDLLRFQRDMDAARRVNARVLINGDIFDAIAPGDKRWTPSCVRKSLRNSDDHFDAITKYAAKILEPYADLIDVIGIGNHEKSWIKWCKSDPVSRTIQDLNAALERQGSAHRIRHGGVAGYVLTKYRLVNRVGSSGLDHRLLYFHGAGGESPVTKGTIDINRKAVNFEFDCVTFGHKHNRLFVDDTIVCVTKGGKIRYREVKAIPTGSYVRNWRRTDQAAPLRYNYAEDWAAAPKPIGGMFLVTIPTRAGKGQPNQKGHNDIWHVRQEVATMPMGATTPTPTFACSS